MQRVPMVSSVPFVKKNGSMVRRNLMKKADFVEFLSLDGWPVG